MSKQSDLVRAIKQLNDLARVRAESPWDRNRRLNREASNARARYDYKLGKDNPRRGGGGGNSGGSTPPTCIANIRLLAILKNVPVGAPGNLIWLKRNAP